MPRWCEVSVADLAQFTLGGAVAGAGCLAQQFVADTAVAGIAALAAHQLAQTALRYYYASTSGLLEQMPGEVFDVGAVAQAWAVEQPQGNFQRKTLGCGNNLRAVGNRR